jgi:hypothetical protein
MAFSKSVRTEIRNRDLTCQDESGETHFGTLDASHIDHTKGLGYQSVENGELLCLKHHLVAHIERDGENGLTESQNRWAIRMLCERIASLWIQDI